MQDPQHHDGARDTRWRDDRMTGRRSPRDSQPKMELCTKADNPQQRRDIFGVTKKTAGACNTQLRGPAEREQLFVTGPAVTGMRILRCSPRTRSTTRIYFRTCWARSMLRCGASQATAPTISAVCTRRSARPAALVSRSSSRLDGRRQALRFGRETRTPAIQAGLANTQIGWLDIFTAPGLSLRLLVAVVHLCVTVKHAQSEAVEVPTRYLPSAWQKAA